MKGKKMTKETMIVSIIEAVIFLIPLLSVLIKTGKYVERIDKLEKKIDNLDKIDNKLTEIDTKLSLIMEGKIKLNEK